MLYYYKDELGNGFDYWSNATGDLHNDGHWLKDENELPKELQRAYKDLWTDAYWVNCYLVEFDSKYGVALEAEYDTDFAADCGISYEELLAIARRKAMEISEKYPYLDVIFGENTMKWSDGSVDSIVSVIIPWYLLASGLGEVANYLDSMVYEVKPLIN